MHYFRIQVSWDGGQSFGDALVMKRDDRVTPDKDGRPYKVEWAATNELKREAEAALGRLEKRFSAKHTRGELMKLLRRVPRHYVPGDTEIPVDLGVRIAKARFRFEIQYGPLEAWEREADAAALRKAATTGSDRQGEFPAKDHLLGLVRSRFPGWLAFEDSRFSSAEVDYKLATAAKAKELLPEEELRSLIDAGDYGEMVERLKRIGRDNNLLYRPGFHNGDLALLYQKDLDLRGFCEAFLDLLYGGGAAPQRLDRYAESVRATGVARNVNRWVVPTYFLFFLYPDKEILVKPRTARTLLKLGGWDGDLGSEPSGEEYARVRTAYSQLREALEEHEPRHMIDVQGFAWVAVQEVNERTAAGKRAKEEGYEQDPRIEQAMAEFEQEADAKDLIQRREILDQAHGRFKEIFGTAAQIESVSPSDFFDFFNELDTHGGRTPGLFSPNVAFPKNRDTEAYRGLEEDLPAFRRALIALLHGEGTDAERLDRMWEIGSGVRHYITKSLPIPSALLFLQDCGSRRRTRPWRPVKWSGILHMGAKEKKLAMTGLAPDLAEDASLGERFVALERALIELPPKYGRKNWGPEVIQDFYFSKAFKRHFVDLPLPPPGIEKKPPEHTLTTLIQSLRNRGLHFPRETVANYLLALQTKRLAILTGVSGTGKTSLAIEVARHFGRERRHPDTPSPQDAADNRRGNYTVVPVRPDWVDNRGLLGYYNPLTNDYSPTPFLRLLLKARAEMKRAEEEGWEPSPFFVVLDEMNLARVEHYFSDFLSAMESGEAIPLHDNPSVERGEIQTSACGRGDADAGVAIPRALRVPDNVFFTGTVNVDETTYMFSPKVLDRAFTIELNEVDLHGYESGHGDDGPSALTLDALHPLRGSIRGKPYEVGGKRSGGGWKPSRRDWLEFCRLSDGRFRDRLLELQAVLEGEHRQFGYRVANEIARFVNLAHEQSSNKDVAVGAAFDLAVLQKVLPKFHGTQQELEPLLRRLLSFAVEGGGAPGSSGDGPKLDEWLVVNGCLRAKSARVQAPEAAGTVGTAEPASAKAGGDPLKREAEDSSARAPALPRTGAKIWRMLHRLELRGFTSFVE